jgi:predicted transcriptional regulator
MSKLNKERTSTVRLGQELDKEVDRLAEDLDIPRSQIVRKAVKQFIARQRHIDEALSEARERHTAYKATGRGVPWEEVSSWLRNGAKREDRPEIRDMHR